MGNKSPSDENRADAVRLWVHELINEGAEYLAAGKATEAIPVLELALKLDPDNLSAAINLGGALVMAGHQRRAVPILERAAEVEPDNAMVWINLAAAYLDRPPYITREGEQKAIAAFERALDLDPIAPSVSYNLGLIHKDRGDLEAALAHFRKAIQADPYDRDALRWHDALQAELDRLAREAAAGEVASDGGVPAEH